jgi:hypothetical protein
MSLLFAAMNTRNKMKAKSTRTVTLVAYYFLHICYFYTAMAKSPEQYL